MPRINNPSSSFRTTEEADAFLEASWNLGRPHPQEDPMPRVRTLTDLDLHNPYTYPIDLGDAQIAFLNAHAPNLAPPPPPPPPIQLQRPADHTDLIGASASRAADGTAREHYRPPNEAGVQGRSRRQQHREGAGGGQLAPFPGISARPSTVDPSLFGMLRPDEPQSEALLMITEAAARFADILDANLDDGELKLEIINRLREIVFWAREAVLRYSDGVPRQHFIDPCTTVTATPAVPTVIPSRGQQR